MDKAPSGRPPTKPRAKERNREQHDVQTNKRGQEKQNGDEIYKAASGQVQSPALCSSLTHLVPASSAVADSSAAGGAGCRANNRCRETMELLDEGRVTVAACSPDRSAGIDRPRQKLNGTWWRL